MAGTFLESVDQRADRSVNGVGALSLLSCSIFPATDLHHKVVIGALSEEIDHRSPYPRLLRPRIVRYGRP